MFRLLILYRQHLLAFSQTNFDTEGGGKIKLRAAFLQGICVTRLWVPLIKKQTVLILPKTHYSHLSLVMLGPAQGREYKKSLIRILQIRFWQADKFQSIEIGERFTLIKEHYGNQNVFYKTVSKHDHHNSSHKTSNKESINFKLHTKKEFVIRKCQRYKKLTKIVKIREENFHIFWTTWEISLTILGRWY